MGRTKQTARKNKKGPKGDKQGAAKKPKVESLDASNAASVAKHLAPADLPGFFAVSKATSTAADDNEVWREAFDKKFGVDLCSEITFGFCDITDEEGSRKVYMFNCGHLRLQKKKDGEEEKEEEEEEEEEKEEEENDEQEEEEEGKEKKGKGKKEKREAKVKVEVKEAEVNEEEIVGEGMIKAKCPACASGEKIDWKRAYQEFGASKALEEVVKDIPIPIGSACDVLFSPIYIYGTSDASEILRAYFKAAKIRGEFEKKELNEFFENIKVSYEEYKEDKHYGPGETKVCQTLKEVFEKQAFEKTMFLSFVHHMMELYFLLGITKEGSAVGLQYNVFD